MFEQIHLEISSRLNFSQTGDIDSSVSCEGIIMHKSNKRFSSETIGTIEWHLIDIDLYKNSSLAIAEFKELLNVIHRVKKGNCKYVLYVTYLSIDNQYQNKNIDVFIIKKLMELYYPKCKGIALNIDLIKDVGTKLQSFISLSEKLIYKDIINISEVKFANII